MREKNNNFIYIMNEENIEEDPELASCWKSDLLQSPSSSTPSRPKSRAQLTPGILFEEDGKKTAHNGIVNLNTDGFIPTPVKRGIDLKRRHLTPGHLSSNSSTPTSNHQPRASPTNNFMKFGLTLETKQKSESTFLSDLDFRLNIPKSPPRCINKTTVGSPRFSPSINLLDPASNEYVPNSTYVPNRTINTESILEDTNEIHSPRLPSFHQPSSTIGQQSVKTKPSFDNIENNIGSMNSSIRSNLRSDASHQSDSRHEVDRSFNNVGRNNVNNFNATSSGLGHLLNQSSMSRVENLPPPPSTQGMEWFSSSHRLQPPPAFNRGMKKNEYHQQFDQFNHSNHIPNARSKEDDDSYQYSSSYPPSPQMNKSRESEFVERSVRGGRKRDEDRGRVTIPIKNIQNNPKTKAVPSREQGMNQEPIMSQSPLQASSANSTSMIPVQRAHEVLKVRETLVETPVSKIAFKEFCRKFRALEKTGGGYHVAWEFAEQCLSEELLPDKVHWRVYLELAERARRENLWRKATHLYSASCEVQPFAAAGWLDWAKLEEERGRLKASCEVLKLGLVFCELNEALVTRRIKLEEKLYNHYDNQVLFHNSTIGLRVIDIEEGSAYESSDNIESCMLGGEHSDDIECRLIAKFKARLIDQSKESANNEDLRQVSDEVHRSLSNLFDDQVNDNEIASSSTTPLKSSIQSVSSPRSIVEKELIGMSRLQSVRGLLGKLEQESIEKIWRAVLEGALLESRNGEMAKARIILKFLIQQVPWYGPVHYEYFRMEERNENLVESLKIMENGLKEVPRYGPLWFGKLRVTEAMDVSDWMISMREHDQAKSKECVEFPCFEPSLTRTRQAIEEAKNCITKELVWKVYFEAAAIEERAALLAHQQIKKRLEYDHLVEESKQKVIKKLKNILKQVSTQCKDTAADDTAAVTDAMSQSTTSKYVVPNIVSKYDSDGLSLARTAFAASAKSCPQNLQWKVWLAGGRMELLSPDLTILSTDAYESLKLNAIHKARLLFKQAYQTVPEKSKAQVMLECARLEEYANPHNPVEARHILQRACSEARNEWKVFLEAVMVEVRCKDFVLASNTAMEALRVHSGTGRLWAILIQLRGKVETWDETLVKQAECYYAQHDLPSLKVMAPFAMPNKHQGMGSEVKEWDFSWAQHFTLKQALDEVPKSGEVWCESGRLHLNPLNSYFDLNLAQRHLEFAVNFTPQYGDSFIEQFRLILIIQKLLPITKLLIKNKCNRIDQLVEEYLNHCFESKYEITDLESKTEDSDGKVVIKNMIKACQESGVFASDCLLVNYSDIMAALESSQETTSFSDDLTARLELTCTNADPNYGMMWFHCRDRPGDSPKVVLRRAKVWIQRELEVQAPLYLQAMARRMLTEYALVSICKASKIFNTYKQESSIPSKCSLGYIAMPSKAALWENCVEVSLRTVCRVNPLMLGMSPQQHDYNTGFVSLNRTSSDIQNLSDESRRKFLFGSDQIIP